MAGTVRADGTGLFPCYPGGHHMTPKLRAFIDRLRRYPDIVDRT